MDNGDIRLRNMTAVYIFHRGKALMLYRIGSRVVAPSWCGIGGHFEERELNDPQSCVIRELYEETGLQEEDLTGIRLRYVTLRLKNGEIRQNYYYFAELSEGAEVSLQSDEGRLRWVCEEELLQLDMPLTAKQMLTHYMETGRLTDKIYSGTTCEDGMVFAELKEF